MKCQNCGVDVFLPFYCPYCGESYCSEHRLPENHSCPHMELARSSRQTAQPFTVQKQTSREYTVTYAPPRSVNSRMNFSRTEAKHLSVATLLVAGVALSIGLVPGTFGFGAVVSYGILVALTIILMASFLVHEMAHKLVAQRAGYWAEFRLTFMGAVLTLVSVFAPFFKVVAPGAVVMTGFADFKSVGRISLAGPVTNIALSAVFLFSGLLPTPYGQVLVLAAAFNAWIAVFNLIPFGMLDGFKIFLWNKKMWGLALTASLVLTIMAYRFF